MNCIASRTSNVDEMLHIHLLTYCLPLLTQALPALSKSATQSNEVHVCWKYLYIILYLRPWRM